MLVIENIKGFSYHSRAIVFKRETRARFQNPSRFTAMFAYAGFQSITSRIEMQITVPESILQSSDGPCSW